MIFEKRIFASSIAILMVIALPLFSDSPQLLALGCKDRGKNKSSPPLLKQIPMIPENVDNLPQLELSGYPTEFTAMVRITGNEPHTHAVLRDTETSKSYRVSPLETEKLLYSYQGVYLLVTGTIIDEPEEDPACFSDGTINPSAWKVQGN